MIADLERWLKENSPKEMPFWPNAKCTGPFGLRSSQELLDLGANPLHLGRDRAGSSAPLKMPFDGRLTWRRLHPDFAAGSLLQIRAHHVPLEIQVMHTEAAPHVNEIVGSYLKGDVLPVHAGSLGLSTGIHTHLEVLMPWSKDLWAWVDGRIAYVTNGLPVKRELKEFCRVNNLDSSSYISRVGDQALEWGIIRMTDRAAVRVSVPPYREPSFGNGKTIHVDSGWLLEI